MNKINFFKINYLVKNKLLYIYLFLIDFILFLFSCILLKKNNNNELTEVKKILLSNISHMGDNIFVCHTIKSIKKKFPNSDVDILTGSWSNQIYDLYPDIKNIYCINHWKLNRECSSFINKFINYYRDLVDLIPVLKKK